MIRSLPAHLSHAVRTKPAQPAVKTSSTTGDFQRLMQPATTATTKPAATTTTPTTTTKTTAPEDVPHLGPFYGDPLMHPAAAPPKAPDPITSSSR